MPLICKHCKGAIDCIHSVERGVYDYFLIKPVDGYQHRCPAFRPHAAAHEPCKESNVKRLLAAIDSSD